MQSDACLAQIDDEVNKLQFQLKQRLEDTQNLADLNETVLNKSFKLEESTFELKKTSVKKNGNGFGNMLNGS